MTPSTSRIAVVTGANKGIGFFIALQLGLSGKFSTVILGCRDVTRGTNAAQQMRQRAEESTVDFQSMPLTIGDNASHEQFCQMIQDKYGKIDVLVNNAGFAYKGADPTPFQEQAPKTFAINYYGLVDFTETMMPLLRKGEDPRLINVASLAGRLKQLSPELQRNFSKEDLTFEELNSLMSQFVQDVQAGVHTQKGWSNSNYGMSKLGVIAASRIWSRREKGIVNVNSCCPGYCATDMSSHRGPRPPEEGARNAVLPATMDSPPTGAFFSDFKVSEW